MCASPPPPPSFPLVGRRRGCSPLPKHAPSPTRWVCEPFPTYADLLSQKTTAIVLDPTFKGRIARTTDTPATWVEVQIKANDGMAWGDVSLETGCDGAAEVSPTDGGQSHTVGFSEPADIVSKASQAPNVTETRADGVTVISIPWSGSQVMNQAAADFLKNNVKGGQKSAYITGTDGTDVAVSSNNRLAVTFY